MRILPISPETTGPAWQVIGQGIRPVFIRSWPVVGSVAAVARRSGILRGDAGGFIRDWSFNVTPAPISDLFKVEQDARLEFRRRCDAVRSPSDRRCRREPLPGDLTLTEGVLASLAFAIAMIMVAI